MTVPSTPQLPSKTVWRWFASGMATMLLLTCSWLITLPAHAGDTPAQSPESTRPFLRLTSASSKTSKETPAYKNAASISVCLTNTCDFPGGETFSSSLEGLYQGATTKKLTYVSGALLAQLSTSYGEGWYVLNITYKGLSPLFFNPSTIITTPPTTGWQQKDSQCTGFTISQGACPVACTPPAISITATPSQTITSGSSVTLTASGADSYTWSNGSTQNPLTLSNVTSATTLSVTGTSGECSGTASAAVSVTASAGSSLSASPPASLNLNVAGCPAELSFIGTGRQFVVSGPDGYGARRPLRAVVPDVLITIDRIILAGTYTITVTGNTGEQPHTTTFLVTGTCP